MRLLSSLTPKLTQAWRETRLAVLSNLKQEKTFHLCTAPNQRDLTIKISYYPQTKFGPGFDCLHEAKILAEVEGARHPYDPQFRYNSFGPDTKNPALMPALDFMAQAIPTYIRQKIQENPSLKRLAIQDDFVYEEKKAFPFHRPSGLEFQLDFGEIFQTRVASLPEVFSQIGLYQNINRYLEEILPKIAALIEENRHLQPPLDPDPVAMMEFEMRVQARFHQVANNFAATGVNVVLKGGDGLNGGPDYPGLNRDEMA